MNIGVYPGSFDPITNGHLDIIKRAANIFDKVVVLVSYNKDKKSYFSVKDRVNMIKESVKNMKNVEVDSTTMLTVRYAKKIGAKALVRGLRVVSDFDYEWKLAAANEYIDDSIEIVFLISKNEYSFISSSYIQEMHDNGVDISKLVPIVVKDYFNKKRST